MSTIDSDIAAAVQELRGHVSAQRYAEAIETLKEAGGEIGAEKINSMYESMDSTQRKALTEALAFGIDKIWALQKFWKLISWGRS